MIPITTFHCLQEIYHQSPKTNLPKTIYQAFVTEPYTSDSSRSLDAEHYVPSSTILMQLTSLHWCVIVNTAVQAKDSFVRSQTALSVDGIDFKLLIYFFRYLVFHVLTHPAVQNQPGGTISLIKSSRPDRRYCLQWQSACDRRCSGWLPPRTLLYLKTPAL